MKDPIVKYLYGLARELHMTYGRLLRELGTGEIAFQIAFDALEADARSKRAAHARDITQSLQRRR